jgi:hypothetical protein
VSQATLEARTALLGCDEFDVCEDVAARQLWHLHERKLA